MYALLTSIAPPCTSGKCVLPCDCEKAAATFLFYSTVNCHNADIEEKNKQEKNTIK